MPQGSAENCIYVDEHGNTGERLLDPVQPIFSLASNDYTDDEAKRLATGLISQGAPEAKFKTLKKTSAGRDRLKRFLTDSAVTSDRIAVFLIHKRYMVFAKLVDILMETALHEKGFDLYKRGANLATTNFLYYCTPAFCRAAEIDAVLESFVEAIRHRNEKNIMEYITAGHALLASCSDKQTRDFLAPFFDVPIVDLALVGLPDNSMDPAIPALFSIIGAWGKRLNSRFCVVHDQSKPIVASEAMFLGMMARINEESQLVGYDRRKYLFPLRATGLVHANSALVPQLQIADVCSGLIAHFIRCQETNTEDDLCESIRSSDALSWVVDAMLPHPDITPEALGTNDDSGSHPIDAVVQRPNQNTGQ